MVTISKQDNAIIFAFTNSQYYLYGNGSIEVPMNALSLVIDESDMITFRKASSNDIFVSIPLDETNFSSKADVITFYKENMVGSTGGGGGGDTDAFVSADYDSQTERINFYNAEHQIVDYIDTTDFVPTVPTNVSDFTNDAGYITNTVNNLTNYYTKTEIDNTVGDINTILQSI